MQSSSGRSPLILLAVGCCLVAVAVGTGLGSPTEDGPPVDLPDAFDDSPTEPYDADRPGPVSASTEPETALTAAALPIQTTSHAYSMQGYELRDSADAWYRTTKLEIGHDAERWRVLTSYHRPEPGGDGLTHVHSYYLGKTAFGVWGAGQEPDTEVLNPFTRTAGNWEVSAVPAYLDADELATTDVDEAFLAQAWTVLNETAETVTYGVDGSDVVMTDGVSPDGLADESAVRATVDRQNGYLLEIVEERHFDRDDSRTGTDATRIVYAFEEWENHTVDRPGELGPPTLVERFVAAIYVIFGGF